MAAHIFETATLGPQSPLHPVSVVLLYEQKGMQAIAGAVCQSPLPVASALEKPFDVDAPKGVAISGATSKVVRLLSATHLEQSNEQ